MGEINKNAGAFFPGKKAIYSRDIVPMRTGVVEPWTVKFFEKQHQHGHILSSYPCANAKMKLQLQLETSSDSYRAAASASGLLSPAHPDLDLTPGSPGLALVLSPGCGFPGLCVMLSSVSGATPGSVSCVLCHHLFQVELLAITAPSSLWSITPHQEAPEVLTDLPEMLLLSTKQTQGRHVGIMRWHSSWCLVPWLRAVTDVCSFRVISLELHCKPWEVTWNTTCACSWNKEPGILILTDSSMMLMWGWKGPYSWWSSCLCEEKTIISQNIYSDKTTKIVEIKKGFYHNYHFAGLILQINLED